MKPKRITFKDRMTLDDLKWSQFTVKAFIGKIKKAEKKLKDKYKYCDEQHVTVEIEQEYAYGDCESVVTMRFRGSRMETPEETAARAERSKRAKIAAQKRKEKKEEEERELLQKLKEKYES